MPDGARAERGVHDPPMQPRIQSPAEASDGEDGHRVPQLQQRKGDHDERRADLDGPGSWIGEDARGEHGEGQIQGERDKPRDHRQGDDENRVDRRGTPACGDGAQDRHRGTVEQAQT